MSRKQELQEPTLLQFYIEYADKDTLREQALKNRTTMGDIIMRLIKKFLKNEKKDD